jgi:hypothetical protein
MRMHNPPHPGKVLREFMGDVDVMSSIVLKEFFVGSGSLQVNFFGGSGVDQHPIRLDVSVSVSGPIAFERVVFVLRRQGLRSEQKLDQSFEFFEVFASLLKPFHIAMKLARIGRGAH